MPDALRESLIGPEPSATDGPLWVKPEDLAGCVDCDTTVDLLEVCRAVSEYLFVLSGRRYKQRYVTVRPKRRVESGCGWWHGWLDGWATTPAGWPAWDWHTPSPDTYELRLAGPVQSIIEVKVDGRALDPGEVALYDARYLVRVDPNGGRASWPADQRLDLSDDAEGTFSVTYVWGQAIPAGGRIAGQVWGCELANQLHALFGGDDCGLPDRVTTLTRQGVTLTGLSALDFLKAGKVGIDIVDRWIDVVNPAGARRPASVTSPDTLRGMRPA